MEIMNIMSPCCWQTSTKSKCLKADDTKPICAVEWPPNEPQQPFNVLFFLHLMPEECFSHDFQRHCYVNSTFSVFDLRYCLRMSLLLTNLQFLFVPGHRPSGQNRSNTATRFEICSSNSDVSGQSDWTRR